jgi:hypothetical protein
VDATATSADAGIPVGTSRFAYLIDFGAAGTLTLATTGTAGDQAFIANAAVVSLMAAGSTFTPPS